MLQADVRSHELSFLLAEGHWLVDSSNDVSAETADFRHNLDSMQDQWQHVLQQVVC